MVIIDYLFLLIGEARKHFKTCVNILSTIKNENNEKYLILRKRYFTECPVEEQPDDGLNLLVDPQILQSPGSRSGISEYDLPPQAADACAMPYEPVQLAQEQSISPNAGSPYREPPPYKPPPKVMHHAYKNQQKYGECVDEYKNALRAMGRASGGPIDDPDSLPFTPTEELPPPEIPPKSKPLKDDSNLTMQLKQQETISFQENEDKENGIKTPIDQNVDRMKTLDKQISVKEATRKFNRIASEEEAAKVTSPPSKKKPEKVSLRFTLLTSFFFFAFASHLFHSMKLLIENK